MCRNFISHEKQWIHFYEDDNDMSVEMQAGQEITSHVITSAGRMSGIYDPIWI